MQCRFCGHELQRDGSCSFCRQDNSVHVIKDDEKYEGITIDASKGYDGVYRPVKNKTLNNSHKKVSFKFSSNWQNKLIFLLLIIALIGLLLFVILPVLAIVFVFGLFLWAFISLLKT